MSTAILSVAVDQNENARYVHFQNRLKASLEKYGSGYRKIFWTNSLPKGSPSHTDSPYAFKLYAIKEALAAGYTKIVWLDAGVYAIREIGPFLNAIDERGVYIVRDDNQLGKFCSDETFEYFKITRAEALALDLRIACGALIGLDFTNPITKTVFDEWVAAYEAGLYKGTYSRHSGMEDHRGDESILGIIMNRHKIPFRTLHEHFVSDAPVRDTSIFRSGYYDRQD